MTRDRAPPDLWVNRWWGWRVLDVVFIAATIAFFALMLAFVRGLERLGRDPALEDRQTP